MQVLLEYINVCRLVSLTFDNVFKSYYLFPIGSILHRLTGHSTNVEITYNPSCPYILTYGSWSEEMALRLWDKTTFEPVTSYSVDRSVSSSNDYLFRATSSPSISLPPPFYGVWRHVGV